MKSNFEIDNEMIQMGRVMETRPSHHLVSLTDECIYQPPRQPHLHDLIHVNTIKSTLYYWCIDGNDSNTKILHKFSKGVFKT